MSTKINALKALPIPANFSDAKEVEKLTGLKETCSDSSVQFEDGGFKIHKSLKDFVVRRNASGVLELQSKLSPIAAKDLNPESRVVMIEGKPFSLVSETITLKLADESLFAAKSPKAIQSELKSCKTAFRKLSVEEMKKFISGETFIRGKLS